MNTNTTWVLDPAHSEILFKVKHLMISNVKGTFKKFEGTLRTEGADFSKSSFEVVLDAASIFTNEENRDNHLRSADFFDVENHKDIHFTGTSFENQYQQTYVLKGLLTIKGISKEVSLNVEFGGINKDPWGNEKAGFEVSGKINRKDWGLTWNSALETGGVLVSDEIIISADVQYLKQV